MDRDLVSGGTLYVVATPLGHLGDLTARATEVLRSVDVVAAEDTRRTRTLLLHLGASPRLVSFHAHSPAGRLPHILRVLEEGRAVALVTDAGTPTISDPGGALVAAARAADVPVVPVPGPSAVVAALSVSGLPADRYLFLGFPPRKGGDRTRWIAAAAESPWTVVAFEAPTRLARLLGDLAAAAGADRQAVVARELTKVHEEVRTGTCPELAAYYEEVPPRGEITLVLAGRGTAPPDTPDPAAVRHRARALLAEGLSRKDTVVRLTEEFAVSRNDAYAMVTEL